MKKTLLILPNLFLLAVSLASGQSEQKSGSSANAGAKAEAKSQSESKVTQGGSVKLDSGTQMNARMSSALDLRKAKPGDSFKMKTSQPVRHGGKEVISRGSVITGHVEQVTRADNTTRATLLFDRIEDKKTGATASLQAVVTAVTRTGQSMAPPDMASEGLPAPSSRPASAPVQRSGQSGGLLGGAAVDTVTSVGGQLGTTADSAAKATLGTGAGVTGRASGLGHGMIQIVTDTSSTVTSGSTLAISDRNPRIDSGTDFLLKTTSDLTIAGGSKERSGSKN